VSPACGAVMLKAGGVISPTRTWVDVGALTLPALSRARKATVCKPSPGKGTCADQFVVPVAACQGPPPNCHSTPATAAGLSAAVPVIVAIYGGAGGTPSGGGLIVSVGGLTSTVTDCEVSALPGWPPVPAASTVAVMVSGPLGLPFTSNLQLVQGVAGGPV